MSVAVTMRATAVVAGTGAWTATSPLALGRGYATGTMLDGPACRVSSPKQWCGKVLVTGGRRSNTGVLGSAELYDPATGRWTFTAPMGTGRHSHTATLLDGPECRRPVPPAPPGHCGKVLVAGGAGGPLPTHTVFASAVLYDPARETWSPTGAMPTLAETGLGGPRYAHSASVLDSPACRGNGLLPLPPPDWCGDVLVVGGLDIVPPATFYHDMSAVALRTAALYDPQTGTWRATGEPAVGRFGHTLTTLDRGPCDKPTPPPYCGRVLLAGGRSSAPVGAGIVAAEIYDPALGRWLPTGSMNLPRFAHKAVLLDGPVCRRASPQCNKVLVAGGAIQASVVNPAHEASAELYDPLTGTWVPTGNLLSTRVPPQKRPLAGTPLRGTPVDSTVPQVDALLPTRGMAIGRGLFHTLTVLDGPACRPVAPAVPAPHCGKVLTVGGEALVSFGEAPPELYDPDGRDPETGAIVGTFSPTRPRLFSKAADGHALVIDGARCSGPAPVPSCGRVLVFGAGSRQNPAAELFDGSATSQPPTVVSLDPPVGPAHGGSTITVHGAGFTGASDVHFGDVPAPAFTVENDKTLLAVSPAMAPGEVDLTVTVGPRTSAAISTTRFGIFPSNYEWARTGSLVFPRYGPTVTPLLDGRALFVGGYPKPGTWGGVDSVEVFDDGYWDTGPSLNPARSFHTATRLPNGEVLVAGGQTVPGVPLGSAVVFDPDKNVWRGTRSMASARSFHTATLLPSGKVLVTGGQKPGGTHSSAELYDPDAIDTATGQLGLWRTVTPMLLPRQQHHAVLLDDGRVLVAGGRASGTDLVSAEVFDPTAGPDGAWSVTGGLSEPRVHHTTTALPGGGALVAGGCGNGNCGYREAAELYDPDATDPATGARGTWKTVEGMRDAREQPTATVITGAACGELCGHVLFAGGAKTSSAELYDPATGAWKPAPSLAGARGSAGAVLLTNGEVLVVGGKAPGEAGSTRSAELFRVDDGVDDGAPAVATVEPPAARPGTRVVIRGTDLSGTTKVHFGDIPVDPIAVTETVVVAESPVQSRATVPVSVTTPLGDSVNDPLSPADDYTYPSGRWRAGPAMSDERYLHTSTLLDGPECQRSDPPAYCGRVLVAGGSANFAPLEEQVPIKSAELYDPNAETWSPTSSMVSPRFNHTATLLDGPACREQSPAAYCGKVLVTGGLVGTDAIREAELYDPLTGSWTRTAPLKAARMSHSATLLADGRVLVVGGAPDEPDRGGLATAEIYDPRSAGWEETTTAHSGRNSHTATRLPDGRVLVTGGLNNYEDDDELVRTTEIYDPVGRTWELVDPMAVPRFAHSAVLLSGSRCGDSCGKILVAGGVNTLGDTTTFHESAELFDPVAGTWSPVFAASTPRAGHTATLLPNGQVLVTGGRMTFPAHSPPPTRSSELFDPLTGRWSHTEGLATRRGLQSASLLDGPACRRPGPPAYCGGVLVAGGATAGMAPASTVSPLAVSSSEIYYAAPDVLSVTPPGGATDGGTSVVLTGSQFAGATAVRFGGQEAMSFAVDSPSSITAVSPPIGQSGLVEVTVEGLGGSSARMGGSRAASFAYFGLPGPVTALVAQAVSGTAVELSFAAADDGDGSAPAQSYVIKQSRSEINEANFDGPEATALCGGTCRFDRPALTYTLRVDDLEPGLTYHYAVRAVNEKGRGPVSVVSVTTEGLVRDVSRSCPQPPTAGDSTVVYPGGRYSLVGLPAGAVVGSQSPLYGWSDLGAGGVYSVLDATSPVTGGHGYWAWFACSAAITLPSGAGTDSASSLPIGAYHASMVGNPASIPATMTGHDFAATWDPHADGGAGAYTISGYREPQTLEVGQGAWAFSYTSTEVTIAAQS